MSDLYNSSFTKTNVEFENLIRNYSIAPPNDPGFEANTELTMDDPANAGTRIARKVKVGVDSTDARLSGSTSRNEISLLKIKKSAGIAYVDINPFPLNTVGNASKGIEGGHTLYMDIGQAPAVNKFPIWFLPWKANSAIRLTLPAGTGNSSTNPNVFFTAAINGCSIFFQGTAQNPTIFHCGGATGFSKFQVNEGAEFWEAVMDQFVQSDLDAGTDKGRLETNVDKREYVSQHGFVTTGKDGRIKSSTGRAHAYERELQAKHKTGSLRVEEVSPWGSVFGRRDNGGNWQFYLQENATVRYYQITSRNPLTRLRGKHTTQTSSVSAPMQIRKIFPIGPGIATIKPTLPKIV